MDKTEGHQPKLLLDRKTVNTLVIVWACISVLGIGMVLIRSRHIGWMGQDGYLCAIVGMIVLVAIFRRRISSQIKVILIICAGLGAGFAGVYSLGSMSGAVFVIALSVVITAHFFQLRAVAAVISISLTMFTLAGIGFSLGQIKAIHSADTILTSGSHWAVYIISAALFFIIAGGLILRYRKETLQLNQNLTKERDALIKAHMQIKILKGIVPICSICKRIRGENGVWNNMEMYIEAHSEVLFSHSMCQNCMDKTYGHESWYQKKFKKNKTMVS